MLCSKHRYLYSLHHHHNSHYLQQILCLSALWCAVRDSQLTKQRNHILVWKLAVGCLPPILRASTLLHAPNVYEIFEQKASKQQRCHSTGGEKPKKMYRKWIPHTPDHHTTTPSVSRTHWYHQNLTGFFRLYEICKENAFRLDFAWSCYPKNVFEIGFLHFQLLSRAAVKFWKECLVVWDGLTRKIILKIFTQFSSLTPHRQTSPFLYFNFFLFLC